MTKAKKEIMRLTSVLLNKDEFGFLEKYAEENDYTVSQLMRRAITRYIMELKAKK